MKDLFKTVKMISDNKSIIVNWPSLGDASENFGDKLTPFLVEQISKQATYSSMEVCNFFNKPVYKVIGSSLGNSHDDNSIVWGTGFISYKSIPKYKPRKIYAVRGPLTRNKFLKHDIDCPEVFGDPALLLPRYLDVNVPKIKEVGFVPHFREANLPILLSLKKLPFVEVISIKSSIIDFIRAIKSCKRVVTSSLHALIVCDTFEIPSLWVSLSSNVLGDGFKFHDYYSSIGYEGISARSFKNNAEFENLIQETKTHKLNIDLEKLLNSCPFL